MAKVNNLFRSKQQKEIKKSVNDALMQIILTNIKYHKSYDAVPVKEADPHESNG